MKKKCRIKRFLMGLFILIFLGAGCTQKDRDVFWTDNNYGDSDTIKTIISSFNAGLNGRDIGKVLNCMDESINFPDSLNPSIKVTYRTLMYDYLDFFEKTESVNYEFNEQYITMSEHTARVTMKLRKCYKAVSPFSHTVDNVVDETVFVSKTASGEWKITGMKELLPPRIY